MALTRAYVEAELVGQRRELLVLAGMSTSVDGSNPDLNDPIRAALFDVGVTAADPTDVSDADLATVPASATSNFMAAARYRLAVKLHGAFAGQPDRRVGMLETKFSQVAEALAKEIASLEQTGEQGATAAGGVRIGKIRETTNPPIGWLRRRVY